jgi:hypothetical protein
MLWMEPDCPLRANRDILLASLVKGLSAEIEIVWSDEMKNDRELVKKCFATAPDCIRFEDDDDDENSRNGSLPSRYLNDMEMLRAFAFSGWGRGTRPDFSPALIHDPVFLADLIVHRCHAKRTGSWGGEIVERAFPAGVQPGRQPLLDSAQFALHLAAGMKGVPAQDRSKCPVSYKMLSPRLQESLEVATAFLRLSGYQMAQVPPALRSNEELWRVAAHTSPGIVYCKWFDPTLCPNLVASKDLALLLVEADPWNYCLGECFAKYFPTFPPEIRNDREVNVQLVLPHSGRKSDRHSHLAPECTHNRDFWLHMAESRKCPCSLWSAVPAAVAGDASIVLAWARHARPDLSDVAWITDANSTVLAHGLLSDRQVLLNWLPVVCSDDGRAKALLRHISPGTLDDKSLWLELLSKSARHGYIHYMSERLRRDYDTVDAQLRSSGSRFWHDYSSLSVELQLHFKHRLVEAIGAGTVRPISGISPELMRIPEVARAAISERWGPDDRGFWDIVKSSSWSTDLTFLLSVANATSNTQHCTFWESCSKGLLRDNDFLSEIATDLLGRFVGRGNSAFYVECINVARYDATNSYDMLEYKGALAREARKRFATYLALETFMKGVQAGPDRRSEHHESAPHSPVVLLSQDGYTMEALKGRLKEYLGAPSDAQFVLIRKVCNTFAKYGL